MRNYSEGCADRAPPAAARHRYGLAFSTTSRQMRLHKAVACEKLTLTSALNHL